MKALLNILLGLLVGAITIAISSGAVFASDNTDCLKQINDTIVKIRVPMPNTMDVGTHLSDLTKAIDPKKVDDKTLGELESLLDSNRDDLRYWGAVALGNLGPRAKIAAPKMLKMLPKVDCLDGVITSSDGIRFALQKMGVKPPPRPACPNRIAA